MASDGDAAFLPTAYLNTVRALRVEAQHELEEALRAQTETIRNTLKDLLVKRAEAQAALDRVDAAIARRRADLERAAMDYYSRKKSMATNKLFPRLGYAQEKHQQQQQQPEQQAQPGVPDADASTGVHVVSSTGVFIGDVMRLESESPIVEILLDLPVLRPVTARADWNADPDRLASIYDPRHTLGDGPGSRPTRWAGVMIQATGEIRKGDDRCKPCAQHLGPFEDCVMLPGHPFDKCGNCEWSKRTCVPFAHSQHGRPPPLSTPNNMPRPPKKPVEEEEEDDDSIVFDQSGISLMGDRTAAADDSAMEDSPPPPVEPITRANLTVRHNGRVYTHPECMEGVPVEKIGPGHPYWDPEWDPDLTSTIRAQTMEWKAKLEEVRHVSSASRFSKNRQVNRGETTLAFLEQGAFHPFQLVSKQYMDAKRLAAFDTLFRLAETIRTLSKHGLDVAPEDWIRHRLQQIITETDRAGQPFDLARTIHNFYHDRQMAAFREEKGIKTIGRPAGYRLGVPPRRKRPRSDYDTSVTSSPAGNVYHLNKSSGASGYHTASFARVDGSPDSTVPGGQAAAAAAAGGGGGGAGPGDPLRKRKRPPTDAELSYEGFTDTDEKIGDRVTKHDFALRSVKSRDYATSDTVTQYWHWVGGDGGAEGGGGGAAASSSSSSDRVFQHQVFLPCDPPQWGVYSAPVHFHFGLQDVQEVVWAPETLKVVVRCRGGGGGGRGDLIGDFARERTKRRFLVFCQKKGLQVFRTTASDIEHAWEQMKAPVLGPLGEPQAEDHAQVTG